MFITVEKKEWREGEGGGGGAGGEGRGKEEGEEQRTDLAKFRRYLHDVHDLQGRTLACLDHTPIV